MRELAAELSPLVSGRTLREVQPHPPRDLLLILEPRGADRSEGIRRLRLSAAPAGPRFHLQIGPLERHRGSVGPFFRAVQDELGGGRLRGLGAVGDDRILRLDLVTAGGSPRSLVLELFGRQSNLLLLDAGGRILSLLVPPREGSSAAARLRPGGVWEAPEGGGGRTAPPLREFLAAHGELPPPPAHAAPLAELAPLSWRVERLVGARAEAGHGRHQLAALRKRLERRLRGARARLAELETKEREVAEAERVRADAELLLAHLPEVKRGMESITLPDAHDPDAPPRTIALDPASSPRRNAERLFGRYRKLQRSAAALPEELERVRTQVAGLEERIAETRREGADAASLEATYVEQGWLPPQQAAPRARPRPEPRRPYFVFRALHGSEIRVGRTARDNDTLTLRHARGNDLWLHTSDSPGSHVVLVLERGAVPDPEEVLDAAHLAIHFSPLRDARHAGVHIARRKEVHKPKGAKPGLVTLSGGRTKRIRVDPARLERLLATRGKPRPGAGQEPG